MAALLISRFSLVFARFLHSCSKLVQSQHLAGLINNKALGYLRIFGNNSIRQSFSYTVFTLTQVSSANGEIVGFFRSWQFSQELLQVCPLYINEYVNPSWNHQTTPLSNATNVINFFFFVSQGRSRLFLLAISTAADLKTVSMIFRLFASIVVLFL